MDNKNEVSTVKPTTIDVIDNPLIMKLSKPFRFEGNEYTELDLRELKNYNTEHLLQAQRICEQRGFNSTVPETTLFFSCAISSIACDLPIEFFLRLPIKDAIKLRTRVTSFLFSEDLTD